ncbi:MAG: type II toxin-antitoxin system RelE/ParE family toxin [Gammaproteobacteria bacterium]
MTLDIMRNSAQTGALIKSFRSRDTEKLFQDDVVLRWRSIERQARRRLAFLHAATSLNSLARNPGNRLHRLSGDRAGQYAIWIDDQWRICFRWIDGHAYEVEIADYH